MKRSKKVNAVNGSQRKSKTIKGGQTSHSEGTKSRQKQEKKSGESGESGERRVESVHKIQERDRDEMEESRIQYSTTISQQISLIIRWYLLTS